MNKKTPLFGALGGLLAGRLIDTALIGGGVSLALGAVGFAGYMTLGRSDAPAVNGMQYLAIFAQPNSHARVDGAPGSQAVDMSPVGAVLRDRDQTGGYALVGADPQFAWLRQGNRIFAVHPGDDVPRLGIVASIERRDGRWALLGADGRTLIVSAVSEIAPMQKARFDRRMIFGER